MKKKILFSVFVLVVTILIAAMSGKTFSPQLAVADVLLDENIEALTIGEYSNPFCYNGGPGAISCSIDGRINIAGYGVSASCSVTCSSGYYACCGIRCTCRKN